MNIETLRKKLIRAARSIKPDDSVPYAFERRVMAHLFTRPAPDAWAVWARVMWQMSAPCVALTLMLSAWVYFAQPNVNSSDEPLDLESVVVATVDNPHETW